MAATVTEHETDQRLGVGPAAHLRGSLRVPGDKSISHRALMLGLLSSGTTRVTGSSDGDDVRSTADIVSELGAEVVRSSNDAGGADYVVRSNAMADLRQPDFPLDCGNSGTTMRLFAGILAGQPTRAILDGDASLRRRPMARIVEPLRAMGAFLEGMSGERPPLIVVGRHPLKAISWTTAVPSAQVKSAILLAGLAAEGTTRVRESVATRDHTERMLRERGVDVRTTEDRKGWLVEIDGGQRIVARDQVVPGDLSAAAFWLVAGSIHPGAELVLDGVGVNPSRRSAIDLLREMGAAIDETRVGDAPAGAGEPIARLGVRSSELQGIDVSPAQTAAAIDEIPILCLAATQARGRTVIRGAGELRHKESDRIVGIVGGLRAMGATLDVAGDDILIDGPVSLRGATVDSLGDHRLAMTFAIAGLTASGQTTIIGADSVGISYPSFFADLERIQS